MQRHGVRTGVRVPQVNPPPSLIPALPRVPPAFCSASSSSSTVRSWAVVCSFCTGPLAPSLPALGRLLVSRVVVAFAALTLEYRVSLCR